MKVCVKLFFEEDFIDFIQEETGIKTEEGIKGYLMGLYANEDIKGIEKVEVEVSNDETY